MAKLLLVDDNQELLGIQGEFLRMSGHEVLTAANGGEALAHAARETFDLVITDIIMPDKDGIEVIVALRKNMPALKVIAISGGGRLNAKDYLSIARKLGASATLAKPFSGSELVATVAQVLAG
jgi:DNA-binding response OmpR family regulator